MCLGRRPTPGGSNRRRGSHEEAGDLARSPLCNRAPTTPSTVAPSTMPTLQLFQCSWCIADAPPARAAALSVLLERCGRPSDDPNCLHHDDDAKPREHAMRRRACSSCDLLSLSRAISASCHNCMLSAKSVAASLRCALAARSGGNASCTSSLSSVVVQGSFFEVVERAANGCALGAGAATRKVKY